MRSAVNKKVSLAFCILIVSVVLSSCGSGSGSGSKKNPLDSSSFPSTVALIYAADDTEDISAALCTASKISSTHFLTASHCTLNKNGSTKSSLSQGSKIKVLHNASTLGSPQLHNYELTIKAVHTPDRTSSVYGYYSADLAQIEKNAEDSFVDISILEVEEEVTDIAIGKMDFDYGANSFVQKNSDVIIGGFGIDTKNEYTVGGLKYNVATISEVSSDEFMSSHYTTVGEWSEYEKYDGVAQQVYKFVEDHDIPYIAQGDSGGPVYYQNNGSLVIVGVNSMFTKVVLTPEGEEVTSGELVEYSYPVKISFEFVKTNDNDQNNIVSWIKSVISQSNINNT